MVYTTFHHPVTQANVVTTDFSDWATNCPEYKVTAVQVMPSNGPTDWQEEYAAFYRAEPPHRGRGSGGVAPWPTLPSAPGRSGTARAAPSRPACVPEEVPVALVYDGTTHAVMMATPADLEDFAVGFSLTEGIIASLADIGELEIVDATRTASRCACGSPRRPARAAQRRRRHGRPDRLRPLRRREPGGAAAARPRVGEPRSRPPADIAAAMGAARAQMLHRRPAPSMLPALDRGAGLVALREDVGRHNALDKLIGALRPRAAPAASARAGHQPGLGGDGAEGRGAGAPVWLRSRRPPRWPSAPPRRPASP